MIGFSDPETLVDCKCIYARDSWETRGWGGARVRDRLDLTMADKIEVDLQWRMFRVQKAGRDPVCGPLEAVRQWIPVPPAAEDQPAEPDVPPVPKRGRGRPRKYPLPASGTCGSDNPAEE